jgi:hypothetical protein
MAEESSGQSLNRQLTTIADYPTIGHWEYLVDNAAKTAGSKAGSNRAERNFLPVWSAGPFHPRCRHAGALKARSCCRPDRSPRILRRASPPRIARPSASVRVLRGAAPRPGPGGFPPRGVDGTRGARGSLARAKLNSARRFTEVGAPQGGFHGGEGGSRPTPTDALLTAGVWDQTGFDVLLAVQAQSAERRWGIDLPTRRCSRVWPQSSA